MESSPLKLLEQYTLKFPQEVLLVTAVWGGETDTVLIYKGFSSSLVRGTPFDPDVPILPTTAEIVKIDRLLSPYNPQQPRYIATGLTWETIQPLLQS